MVDIYYIYFSSFQNLYNIYTIYNTVYTSYIIYMVHYIIKLEIKGSNFFVDLKTIVHQFQRADFLRIQLLY